MNPAAHLLLSIGGTFVAMALGAMAYMASLALPLIRQLVADVHAVRKRLDEAAEVTPRR